MGYARDLAGAMSGDAAIRVLVDDVLNTENYYTQVQGFDAVLYQWSKGAIKPPAFNDEFI